MEMNAGMWILYGMVAFAIVCLIGEYFDRGGGGF